MHWLPRTLQARIALLFLMLLTVGQLAAFQMFEYFERAPRAQAAALRIASTVNLTRAALLAASPERRQPLLGELNQREGVRIYPVDLLEEIEPLPASPMLRSIAEKVVKQLGPETLVTYNHLDTPGLWVSFSIGDDDYWLVLPRPRPEHGFPWHWLGWGTLLVALSLGSAWLIMLRINRPLQELARAADAIGRGESGERLSESGAEEFSRVTRAFNTMSEALARADADRNLLLGGVSHDLRTPLSRLRLAVEMLPQQEPLKSGMVQDIDDMDAIVGQFLDLIRGTAGEALVPVDLDGLATELAQRFQRAGKVLTLDLGGVPMLNLRCFAMQRLITNLVENAFHHGGEPVLLHTHREDGKVVLSVLDHGAGLPESETARLLRPFEQLNAARGDAHGAGLGLAISARIALLHGGRLMLRNRPEGGLEARVELPISS
jgi:two-component system osmolarity sensor histidine kinase EnvZ